jgi:hypothetical protein
MIEDCGLMTEVGGRRTEVRDRRTEEAPGRILEERLRTDTLMIEDGDLMTEVERLMTEVRDRMTEERQRTQGGRRDQDRKKTGGDPVTGELVRDHTNPGNNTVVTALGLSSPGLSFPGLSARRPPREPSFSPK